MTNVLVSVRMTVDVREEFVEALMKRPDDDSDDYYAEACEKAQEWVADNLPDAMEMLTNEPDIEAD